jgi:hypothetical protein
MQEEELLRKAKRRINTIKGFYAHLVTYISVIVFLCIINFMTDPGEWWVIYPAAGWGLAVLGHYFGVFGFSAFRGSDWEEKALEQEMDKLRRKNGLTSPSEEAENLELEEEQLELKAKIKQEQDYDDQDLV